MTTLYVPLQLPAVQAQRFLDRELRHREIDSVKVHGNMMVIEHYPRSVFEVTPQDIADYFGLNETTIIV